MSTQIPFTIPPQQIQQIAILLEQAAQPDEQVKESDTIKWSKGLNLFF